MTNDDGGCITFGFTTKEGTASVSLDLGEQFWRKLYAGLAMQGIIATDRTLEMNGGSVTGEHDIANAAYRFADAMIAEGRKDNSNESPANRGFHENHPGAEQ